MLLKGVEIQVFKLDNTTFDSIGQINEYTSLIWPDKYNGFSQFELNAPVNQENKDLIKKDNVIWCGGDKAAFIEIIHVDTKENGQKVFKAKGRTLEMILTTRIIWGTYSCVNKKTSTAMYEIVNISCVNPIDPKRKIPFLECAEDEFFGYDISFQQTGGETYDTIESLAKESELGFCILFRPIEKKLIFKVLKGVDRTITPTSDDGGSRFVIFSTDLEDILSSSYYTNNQDVKSVALIAGEGTGSGRRTMISGDDDSFGFLRRELYVDARDLQTEIYDNDGNILTIPQDEYDRMLGTRGKEKLAERKATELFEAKVRVIGDVQYQYGVDYFKGDKVFVHDSELDILITAIVAEATESFSDKYSLDITFGFSYPTLIQKIKKQIL